MVALRRGGVAALVILALASSFSAIHALPEGSPDQYLAVKLGMPTVRPRPARRSLDYLRRLLLLHRAPSRRALLTSTHALPTQTNDGKKPRADEEKSDVYQHMHSRTTKVGEGSTSAKEIATKALKVLSRLARSDTSDEAAKLSHAQSWTDDLVDDLDDDSEDEFVDDYDDDDWDEPRAALGREPGGDAPSPDGTRHPSTEGGPVASEDAKRRGARASVSSWQLSATRAMNGRRRTGRRRSRTRTPTRIFSTPLASASSRARPKEIVDQGARSTATRTTTRK